MNVTDQVRAVMAEQEAADPDRDPGDVTISMQDDMPLVTVDQHGWEGGVVPGPLGWGETVQEAVAMWRNGGATVNSAATSTETQH